MRAWIQWCCAISTGKFLLILLLVAATLRVGAVLALRDIRQPPGRDAAGADAVQYDQLALSLARSDGYSITPGKPTSFRAPGLPFFLSVVYRISYANYPLAYFSLLLLSLSSLLVTYFVARCYLGEPGGRLAGILGAVYFPHVYASTVFLSETLFTLLLGLFLYFSFRALEQGLLRHWLLAGLLLGAATLTRSFAVLILPLITPLILLRPASRPFHLRLASLAALGLGSLALVTPWAWRNYELYGRLVLSASNGGSTFYGANNDLVLNQTSLKGYWVPTGQLPERDQIRQTAGEVDRDRLEYRLGWQWIRAHWIRMPELMIYKLLRFILPDILTSNWKYRILNSVTYLPYGTLLIAFPVLFRRREYLTTQWSLMHLTMAATLLVTLVFQGSSRFRDANFPILITYCAAVLQLWIPRFGVKANRTLD